MSTFAKAKQLYWVTSTDELWHSAWSSAEIAGKTAAEASASPPLILTAGGVPLTLCQIVNQTALLGSASFLDDSSSAFGKSHAWAATSALCAGLHQTALQVVELADPPKTPTEMLDNIVAAIKVCKITGLCAMVPTPST